MYRLATFESRVSETVTGFRQKDVAEALDLAVAGEVLKWVRAILWASARRAGAFPPPNRG